MTVIRVRHEPPPERPCVISYSSGRAGRPPRNQVFIINTPRRFSAGLEERFDSLHCVNGEASEFWPLEDLGVRVQALEEVKSSGTWRLKGATR